MLLAKRWFITDFKNIGKQEFLRLDFGYRYFFDIQGANIFSTKNNVRLRDVLKPVETKKVTKGGLEEPKILIDIDNIERRFNNLINCEEVSEIGSDKNVLFEGDIVIPKMRPWLGGIFLNIEHKEYIGSSELLEYKITPNNNPHFIYYLFTAKKFLSDLVKLKNGNSHKRVNQTDLLKIQIPHILKFTQDQIVFWIKPIEKKIKETEDAVKKPQEIINQVFAREFDFDLKKFENLKKEKFFEASFCDISKSSLIRSSFHFHHKNSRIIEEKLKNRFWVPVNSVFGLSKGGIIPKGEKFSDDETDYFYLRPKEVNFWGIDKNSIPRLSAELYNKLKKHKVISGELCISIIGTLGKTALINTDNLEINKENLILNGNFLRLSPKQVINHQFYFYYFYSFIFQAQTNREYTITTIKALGIDKWSYIKVPKIPLSEQEKVVTEIKNELDKQEVIKQKIEDERDKIDDIINCQLEKLEKFTKQ